MKLKPKEYIEVLAATVLGIIATGMIVRFSWELWDDLVDYLNTHGCPPETEYLVAGIIVALAVWLGLVKLRKFKK